MPSWRLTPCQETVFRLATLWQLSRKCPADRVGRKPRLGRGSHRTLENGSAFQARSHAATLVAVRALGASIQAPRCADRHVLCRNARWFTADARRPLLRRYCSPSRSGLKSGNRISCVAVGRFCHSAVDVRHGKCVPISVIDLIPVRPLQEHEDAIRGMFTEKLAAIYRKIKP